MGLKIKTYLQLVKRWTCFLLVFVVLAACGREDKTAQEIAKIPVELTVHRFDCEFAQVTPESLSDLRQKYPYLFPAPDSVWIAKSKDTLQHQLAEEVDRTFGDFAQEQQDLEELYRHILYYFPKTKLPTVITMTSDVDYNNRVVLADSLLLIGLDNYLGADHKFYGGIQHYIAQGLDKEYLVSDVASAFAQKVVPPPSERSFLAQMIYYGKELYLKDKLLPSYTDAQKIAYTQEQWDWVKANEEQVWRYFVERELLYSTDRKLGPRFLDPAPFSKFQLELDNESPGRVGRYMGWQMVRSFAQQHPKLSLIQVLQVPAMELFKEANYKPKK